MEKQFEAMYDQVFDLIEKGRTAEAMEIAQQLVDANMSDALAWYAYGYAKQAWGDHALACKGFEQAIAINPNCIPAYVALAELSGDVDNFDAVIQYCDKALSIDPFNTDAMYNKVLAVDELNGTQAAIQLCNEYIEKADEKIQLENLLGILYIDQASNLLADIPDDPDVPQGETTPGFISLQDLENARQLCTSAQSLLTLDNKTIVETKNKCNLILQCCDDDLKLFRWSKASAIVIGMVSTFVVYAIVMSIFSLSGIEPLATLFGLCLFIAPWLNIPASRFPQYQVNYAIYTNSYPWKFKNETIGNAVEKTTDPGYSQSWIGLIARSGINAFIMRVYLYKRWIKALKDKINAKKVNT